MSWMRVEEGFVSQADDEQAPVKTSWVYNPENGDIGELAAAIAQAVQEDFPVGNKASNPVFVYSLNRLKKRC